MMDDFIPGVGPSLAAPLRVRVLVRAYLNASIASLDRRRDILSLQERVTFWRERAKWPRDALGQVFLGNAAHRIGKAMFPGDWTTFEPTVDQSLIPIDLPPPSKAQIEFLGQERLEEAARAHRELSAMLEGPRQRWQGVQLRLADAMLGGWLPYCVRHDDTGEFGEPLPVTYWNTEPDRIARRFHFCKINPLAPIVPASKGHSQWIFVNGDALARLANAIETANEPARSLRKRDVFAALLLDAVKASPDANPTTRDDWQARAREEFRLPRDTFETIWRETLHKVPGSKWNRPGRRSNKPPGKSS